MKVLFERVDNIVGKGENANYEHFVLFPQCFQKSSSSKIVKSWDCMVKAGSKELTRPLVLTIKNLVRASGLSFFFEL